VICNGLFVVSATLYLLLAIYDVQWEDMLLTLPPEVVNAEDDAIWAEYGVADDYVFQTPHSQVWVSKYVMIYFCASVGFVLLGTIEFFQYRMHFIGIFFILAGIFGVLAAMFVEKDEDLSYTFNLVSCGLFSLEAVQIMWERYHYPERDPEKYKWRLRIADASFLVGAVMELIIAFITKFSGFTFTLASVYVFGACLWIICALIYTWVTICRYRNGDFSNHRHHKNSVQKKRSNDSYEPMESEAEQVNDIDFDEEQLNGHKGKNQNKDDLEWTMRTEDDSNRYSMTQ
jgi:hypothetical protein